MTCDCVKLAEDGGVLGSARGVAPHLGRAVTMGIVWSDTTPIYLQLKARIVAMTHREPSSHQWLKSSAVPSGDHRGP